MATPENQTNGGALSASPTPRLMRIVRCAQCDDCSQQTNLTMEVVGAFCHRIKQVINPWGAIPEACPLPKQVKDSPTPAAAQLEWLWAHAHIVVWPADGSYPIEHLAAVKKDGRAFIEAEMVKSGVGAAPPSPAPVPGMVWVKDHPRPRMQGWYWWRPSPNSVEWVLTVYRIVLQGQPIWKIVHAYGDMTVDSAQERWRDQQWSDRPIATPTP
jgi:hypothetical protein